MEAVAIKSVLQEVFHHLDGGRQQREQQIILTWEKAVGPKAASHTKIQRVKNKTLVVKVDSSPWLYLLTIYKGQILKKMRNYGCDLVRDEIAELKFKTGQVQND